MLGHDERASFHFTKFLPDITGRTALAVRPVVVNAKYHVITNATYNRDPVPEKFKHVTNIETCTLPCCDYSTLWEALHANKVEIYAHRMCGSRFTQCSDPEPHTDRHSLMYHHLWTLAIGLTSSLYGLKIIPKSAISLIDALFVFLRYTFFLIYVPAKIRPTWTLY